MMNLGDQDPFGVGVPFGEDAPPSSAGSGNDAPAPDKPATPSVDPRLAQVAARLIGARDEKELAQLQADIRRDAGIDRPEPPPAPRDWKSESELIRQRLIQKMDGQTDEEKAAAFAPFEELGAYHYARLTEQRLQEQTETSRRVVSELLSRLGVTPEDFADLRAMREERRFQSVFAKYGADKVRPYVKEAQKIQEAASKAGYPVDEETAVLLAHKKAAGKVPADADEEDPRSSRRPPVPSAESGPDSAARQVDERKPLGASAMRDYIARMSGSDESRQRFKAFGSGVGSRVVRPERAQ